MTSLVRSGARSKALHVKCERNDDGKIKGLSYEQTTGTYTSGWWNLADEQSESLIGGWLYLHPPGAHLAEIGGRVLAFKRAQVTARGSEARTIFIFDYSKDARHQPWRGIGFVDRRVWHGGFVEADLPHEIETPPPA